MTGARGATFWIGAAVGAATIAYGIGGLVHEHAATDPPGLAVWLGGAGIAHDAFIAPLVVAGGLATRRLSPASRVPVRLGLAASALLVALVWPLVAGWGQNRNLPSALPLDYGHNLAVALGVVWVAVVAAIVVRASRA